MRLPSRTLALLAAAVALLVSAFAAPAGATVLSTRLGRALDSSGVARSRTSALAINVTTGGAVFRRNPGTPLRPASNEKLTVALAALDRLGGASRIPTRVLGQGRPIGTVWLGSLILKGYGDPMLTHAKLVALARAIRALGITRVTGSVLWDESYFDTVRTAPGWKPWYYRNECAPLSALVADEADVGGRVVGRPAYWAASPRASGSSEGSGREEPARQPSRSPGSCPRGSGTSSGAWTVRATTSSRRCWSRSSARG
ncbi:MAG: hypothetical protein E6G67_14140 [Actinobacteria bacterium]|nr:MAG: hypothetical protein E6G67_14140 [Actinomycetota bacterium]